MNQDNSLFVPQPEPTPSPFALTSWDDMDKMAKYVAQSGMFGVTNPAQAICLFAIAQGEGISALAVLKKYHIIEGKPSMRADAMLAEFQKAGGGVIYHARTDSIVAATYFSDRKKIGPEAEKRAIDRMEIMLKLESTDDMETSERLGLYLALTKLNREGEQTIVRTLKDAVEKGITQGKDGMKLVWKRYSRAMLAARCDTEGIRILMPGLISGIMETNEAIEVGEDFRATLPDEQPRKENRDLESMKAILKQYEEEYPEASKSRQKQLQPLMGDLREKISNIEHPERFAQAARKPEPKNEPQIVDATFEMVDDEPNRSPKSPAAPQEQAAPAAEAPKPADPATNWKNYRVKHVGGAFKDKLLTEIDIDDLEVLTDSLAKKAAKVSGAAYKEEFDMMTAALSERTAEAQGLKKAPAKAKKDPEKEPF